MTVTVPPGTTLPSTLDAAPPLRTPRRQQGAAVRGYALLAPSLLGVVLFLALPIVVVVWLSFHEWDVIGQARYVGLAKWGEVLGDGRFARSLGVTGLFLLLVVPVQTALGLLVAALLARGLPGSVALRTVYVLPWVCAPLALGVVWKWIFTPTGGVLNTLLGHRVEWLSDPALALPSVAAVSVWSHVGYVALFFLAGLSAIPDTVVEAARLDGAGATRIFWRIKVPLLRPTLFFVLVTGVISTAQTFDTVYALTGGGPGHRTEVVAARIYAEAFSNADLGAAAVMSLVVFVLLVAVTVGQHLWFSRRITYDVAG